MVKLDSIDVNEPKDGAKMEKSLKLVFDTENKGYYQCIVTKERGLRELTHEPSLFTFPTGTQREIKQKAMIAFYFTTGTFPEDLSAFDT
jgi:hypothetical protein